MASLLLNFKFNNKDAMVMIVSGKLGTGELVIIVRV